MSRADAMRSLRRNESFIACSKHLSARGIEFEAGFGGKHPFIIVKAPDRAFRFSFVGTPSDYRSALNDVRDLKRRLDGLH